jgi:hypothetical protein
VPGGTANVRFTLHLAKERFLEFKNGENLERGDDRVSSSDGRGYEDNVVELVVAGRKDGSAAVYLRGIEEIENGELLGRKDFVHAFQTEATFSIEKVGEVGLPESDLLGQANARQRSTMHALQKNFPKVFLHGLEVHWGEHSVPGSRLLVEGVEPRFGDQTACGAASIGFGSGRSQASPLNRRRGKS